VLFILHKGDEAMQTLIVTTHSGLQKEVTVDIYNPTELEAKLNNSDIHSINLGDSIFSRIDIKNIIPKEVV
jgi:hypothetical protein